MYLKELELVGFKSFPEKTRLRFEPGITAIVGPNGCGKSNIFDGIRWVLGEQSTKALRSLKMEDIIFNGTDNKSSLAMAEVSLIFCNRTRKFSVDSDEIEVCRRGAESYSLIEQGKIDMILSSRPEERRLIFDEASGITKYKTQKKEALRKLEETEQNLLRVSDIIAEVRREISSLERQANKARRYKEIFEELKNEEIKIARLDIFDIEGSKQELSDKINSYEDNINSRQRDVNEVQKEISLKINRIKILEKEVSDYHEKILNINNLINNNTHRFQMDGERVVELKSRINDLKNQLREAKVRIENTKNDLENFQRDYNELKNRVREQAGVLLKKQNDYEQMDSSIRSSQDKIKRAKDQILDLVTIGSQFKNEMTDLEAHSKSQILRKKRLDIEKIKTKEEKENVERVLNQHRNELDNMKCEFKQLDNERTLTKDRLANEINTEEGLSREIQNLENQKIALQSQKEFLEELKLKYEGIKQSLNAIVYLDRSPGNSPSGILIKINQPPQSLSKEEGLLSQRMRFRLGGEAKPMPLETAAIIQKIEELQSEINQKQEKQRLIQKIIQELNQNLKNLEQKAKAKELLISNKGLQVENLTEQLNKMNQEYEVVNLEIEDLENQIQQLNEKQAQLESKINQTSQQQKTEEEAISQLENFIVELRSKREGVLVNITQIKTEIESQDARLMQQEKTREFLEDANRESQQLYRRYIDEVQQSESKIGQLEEEIEKLTQENNKAAEDRIKLNEEESRQQKELEELNKLREEDGDKINLINQDIEGLRKHVHEHELQMQELDFNQRSIRDRINQVYKMDLEDCLSLEKSQDKDREILTVRINELKKRLDSLGTVNLIAIEEYEELKKRYDFLNQQQEDLNKAKDSLNEAIKKINRITRQMFLETFKKIQIEFRSYFRLLFGGGEAEIVLVDEADPLESGIEIICRPPGKKLQNVLALSGGEKALAAVALLFAIFKVNPSPFCVLDEIDAALDEANIDRFSGILRDFAKKSQFLVITHNKKTIVNADVMYGITMQEPGISKIVSVKLA